MSKHPVTSSDHRSLQRHPLRIPEGGFCYRVEPSDGVVRIAADSPRLGRDIREASFGKAGYMVLCPYWTLTEHGTVRCEYLGIEVLAEEAGASEKAAAYFSHEEACRLEWSFLSDMLKECTVNPGKETDWSILFPRTEFPG